MAKYIIDVPNDLYAVNGTLRVPVIVGNGDMSWYNTYLTAKPYTEPDRKAIENEVWDFVSRLIWSFVDREILGMDIALAVRDMTYQEAKEKYESWRKQKDEIHEYDEIISEVSDNKATIVRIDGWGRWHCINADGSFMVEINQQDCWKKTGRSFPELGDVLKKMREE